MNNLLEKLKEFFNIINQILSICMKLYIHKLEVSSLDRSYLYARRVGIAGTAILETTRKEAIQIIRRNRRTGYQLGILCGPNYDSLRKVYGEYAPYRKVATADELIKSVEV